MKMPKLLEKGHSHKAKEVYLPTKNVVGVDSCLKTLRFRPSVFKTSTETIVFKKLRFHLKIFRFHVDDKLKRKNKLAPSLENIVV